MRYRLTLGYRIAITVQTASPITIVSGGQTGVDRAALDAAMRLGLDHGGYCPAGRLAEDGAVPEYYDLVELPTRSYPARTRANVAKGCATVVITETATLSRGSNLTLTTAARLGKPSTHYRLSEDWPAQLADWLRQHNPRVLNIGGTRASKEPGIYGRACGAITEALSDFLDLR